jgi:hypothetical protein
MTMAKRRPLEVTSRLVDGDYVSFKAANSRSLLGVTYIKNKRKPNISQSRRYNQVVVEELIRYAHSKLQQELGSNILKYLKLHTALKIDWDSAGRIKEISDLRISVYSHVGELDLGNIVFGSNPEKIIVDLFYSKVDAASPLVQSGLKELESAMGADNLQVNTYDFFSDEGKHKARLLNVSKVPTGVINGTVPLENPTKNQIFDRVNEMLTPSLKSSRSDFMLEPSSKLVYETLASKTK